MKIQLLILSMLTCICLFAQYDGGTVIYEQTGSTNLTTLLNYNYELLDFDGDNYIDVLMVESDSTNNINQLMWYKGDGNGNFSEQTILLTFEYSVWGYDLRENEIFYTDMNQDGIKDIVFQNTNTGFTTLLSSGQGSISAQINNELVTQEYVFADLKELADVDGDGDMDGIFFTKQDSYYYYSYYYTGDYGHCLVGYNDGNGNFNNFNNIGDTIPEIFVHIETGDIDGDGDLDIICSGNKELGKAGTGGESPTIFINPFVRMYENLGVNAFNTKQEIAIPVIGNEEPLFTYIRVQDINADGKDELMIEYAILDNCLDDLHFHDCTYFYQFHVLDYEMQNEEFTISETYNSWLHGYGMNEYFNTPPYIYNDAFLIQFGNQNEDENLDILSVNVPQGKIQWNLGDGKGGFETNQSQQVHTSNEYSTNSPALRAGDVDNDGDLDVFVLLNTNTTSTLTLFKNETPVSINNHNFVFGKMGISPNPVQGNSYIQLSLAQSQNLSKATYRLYNLQGKKIMKGIVDAGRIFIPNLSGGIYLLEIDLDNKKHTNKIVIK